MSDNQNANALPIGTMIQEYRVLQVLGAGSFGIVYKAENVYLDEVVAIKEFLPIDLACRKEGTLVVPLTSETEEPYDWALRQFLKEAQILWDLARPERHPNIIRVSRFHEDHGTAYIVMDHEQGRPFSEVLGERDPATEAKLRNRALTGQELNERTLPETPLRAILGPLLDGLARVHARSVWHRDIKPGNILIRADGSPVLIDFGAARQESPDRARSVIAMFSPAYAAPEQVVSMGEHGPWTDIYALGATCYRAVAGKLPIGASERALGVEHIAATEAGAGRYSQTFLQAIDAALALVPGDRPQDIKSWQTLLDQDAAATVLRTDSSRPETKTRIEATQLRPSATLSIAARRSTTRSVDPEPRLRKPDSTQSSIAEYESPVHRTEQPRLYDDPQRTDTGHSTKYRSIGMIAAALAAVGIAGAVGYYILNEPPAPQPKDSTTALEGPAPTVIKPDDAAQTTSRTSESDTERESELDSGFTQGRSTDSEVRIEPDKEKERVAKIDQPPPDYSAIQAAITEALTGYKCADLAPILSSDRRLFVTGYVANSADLRKLESRLQALEHLKAVQTDVNVYEPPFCAVLGVIGPHASGRESATPPKIAVNSDNRTYREGDHLIIEVTGGKGNRGYLYVDHMDNAGDTVHILPNPLLTNNSILPGQIMVLGADTSEELEAARRYPISPPHGRSLIFAVFSSQPLFEALRPEVERAGDYLDALSRRLEQLNQKARGDEILTSFMFIESHR